MDELFLSVLNMSLTGAFIITAIIAARLLLKKLHAPKWISYALWAVAGFRLACPFTIESILSLIPQRVTNIMASADSPLAAGNPEFLTPVTVNGQQMLDTPPGIHPLTILTYIWLTGIAVMLLYAVISYVSLLRRKDSVATPFVYGFMKPKIHIPNGLAGEELRYVALHEQTHMKRRDHLVKLFAFLLLCIHWFNPLAWAAFLLACADMEMSCDERVMKELGGEIKHNYSLSLVRMSAGRRMLNCSPLAFGEGGLKERVKNVLNFKKPSRWIVLAAVLLVAVLTVGFAVNSSAKSQNTPEDAVRAYLTDPANIEKFGEGKDDEMNVIDLRETPIKPGNYNGVVIAVQDENTAYVDATYQTAKTNMAYYKCVFALKRENTGSPWAVREYYSSALFEDPVTTLAPAMTLAPVITPSPAMTPSATIPLETTAGETVASMDTSNWQSVVKSKFGIDISLPDGWTIIGASNPSFTDPPFTFTRLTFTTGGSMTAGEFGAMIFDATKAVSTKGNTDVNNGAALETFADATLFEGFSTWVFALSDNSMNNYIVRVHWRNDSVLTVSIA
ncbi:MAG: M56 family metallopeptidase [Christensenellales bacterium]